MAIHFFLLRRAGIFPEAAEEAFGSLLALRLPGFLALSLAFAGAPAAGIALAGLRLSCASALGLALALIFAVVLPIRLRR